MVPNQPAYKRITLYDLILMSLAIISIVIVIFLAFLPHDEGLYRLFRVLDSLIALVFLGDFFARLSRAPNRSQYFFRQLGWLDLLGGIPINGVGIFRLARLVRGVRALRHTNAREFFGSVRDQLAQNTLLFTAFIALFAVFAASASVLVFETREPGANIHTAQQAIWWAFVTVATVGYGDFYPVTTAGRLTGILLMVVGIGVFGVMSAFLANAFIAPHRNRLFSRSSELAELKQEMLEQRQILAQIQSNLTPNTPTQASGTSQTGASQTSSSQDNPLQAGAAQVPPSSAQ
jgi:voltage-gated potassium channel